MAYQLRDIDDRIHGIHVNVARGVDDVQNYAMKYATSDDVDGYEHGFQNRISNLKTKTNDQLDDFNRDIIRRRPSRDDTNYEQELEDYQTFLTHANDGVKSIKSVFHDLFSKLFGVVKTIVKWIVDRLPNIVTAIAVVFGHAILPLLGVM